MRIHNGQTIRYLDYYLGMDKEDLVNELYDRKVADLSDYDSSQDMVDTRGHGKRIPYIGWFWRQPDYVRKRINIGDCGEFIGVMESNKWDYPSRWMTEEEVDKFLDFLEKAFDLWNKPREQEGVCRECWDWFQTLKIEG